MLMLNTGSSATPSTATPQRDRTMLMLNNRR